jgi:hypothetical protein
MKKLITYLFCFSTLISLAQHTINGNVTNSDGQPIVGANVYLEGTYDGATTNYTGEFSFSTEETGNQKLIISYLSYETKRIEGVSPSRRANSSACSDPTAPARPR